MESSPITCCTDWQVSSDGIALERRFRFKQYREALAFVVQVAVLAEQQNHHPDIEWCYTTVTVRLSTHDAGGLTERDTRLAEAISAL